MTQIPFRSLFLLTLFFECAFFITHAQQNLFNVPTSDITEEKKLFFQQQFNLTKETIQFNTTFSYGLGHNWEVGFNFIGLNLNTTSAGPLFLTNGNSVALPFSPFYTFNVQKAFQLSAVFKLAIGTQTGLATGGNFGSYVYSNLVTIIPKTNTKLITGLYWGSDSFLGCEDRSLLFSKSLVETQIGVEQPIFGDRLSLIAENISGKHALGETSLGGAWRFTKHWVWSAAWQFPNYQGRSPEALVIELTFVP